MNVCKTCGDEYRQSGSDPTLKLDQCMPCELMSLRIAIGKVNDIRNSIIACQTMNWSEHIYPLVAVLESIGIEGKGYPGDRENLGTLIEQRERAVECLADAFGDYCEANPDPDHAPEPWADEVQEIIGTDRALDIFNRRSKPER